MPRMPKIPEGLNPGEQSTSWIPKPKQGTTNDNIKLILLEDKLRDDLAPKNVLLLDKIDNISKDTYIYIYDKAAQKLKHMSTSQLQEIFIDDVDQKIEVDNIIAYTYADHLPDIDDAKPNTIYIVPTEGRSGTRNLYDEYIFIKEQQDFEKLGNVDTDLSEYRPAEEQDVLDKALKDLFFIKLTEHTTNTNNPHHVTKEQLGVHDDPELAFSSHYEFPNNGKKGLLYIATDEQITYFWDGSKYVAIKGDVPDIDYINCGGAE